MSRPYRLTVFAWALSLLLANLSPAALLAQPATELYVGHSARLTARIPAAWTVDPTNAQDYTGPDGFIASAPLSGTSLRNVCRSVETSGLFAADVTVTDTTWAGRAACRVDGTVDYRDASVLVVPHPHTFADVWQRFDYAAVITDPEHFADIVATLDFSPERVTPEAYLASMLDVIEARAWRADDVEWGLAREQALAMIENQPDLATAHMALDVILGKLRAAGDNHSLFLPPDQRELMTEAAGFGLLIGGQRVLAVYPEGPAYRSGVRAGDIIEEINGQPMVPIMAPVDPGNGWGPSVQLAVRRPDTPEKFAVTITQGPYTRYLPPTGRRLANDLGYISIPGFSVFGRQVDYVAAARRVIATADRAPACGWVVDLRLDTGGVYAPMVTGIGPILGDGPFLGWQTPDDRQLWVTYQNGDIYDDGRLVAADLARMPAYELQHPDPPVAVLTGPLTSSSGEVTTLAFLGRPETRLFGERTGGFTTGNASYLLFDGALLALAEVAMTDRTGETYMGGIMPDVLIRTDWATYGTDADPVLARATEWLGQQPACAAA